MRTTAPDTLILVSEILNRQFGYVWISDIQKLSTNKWVSLQAAVGGDLLYNN